MGIDAGETSELERLRRRVSELEARARETDSRAPLHSIFDQMFEGIQILDFDWRYVYLNATAAGHGRRPPEALIGQKIAEMYPGIEQTEVFRLMRKCMAERAPQQMVNQFAYPDGRKAWFDLRISPVPMGILVLSVDISAQKSAEEELRQSRENLATTLQCMAEGVITTDGEGRVTAMNPSAEGLTGWAEGEAMGRFLDDLVRFLDQRQGTPVDHPVAKVLRKGVTIGLANDTVLVRRDGSRVPIASSGAPIRDAQGAIRGAVLVLKDMKEEYFLADMLHQAQKMEAVGRLAGGVAHDFNNLLTVIGGYSELLLKHASGDAEIQGSLQQIQEAAQRAGSLTRQLLAYSRKQVLKPEPLDLNAVVGRIDKMLRRLIGEDVDLVTKLHPKLDVVMADPGQIEQILMNLAVNARDAMPRGGMLTIETANVELDDLYSSAHPSAKPGPHVMIAVTDTGTGMDAETQARIFEPFFTTKDPGKGTGLGLSTVYGIVKQSGGNIWVYSEPGRGTTFKVYLPRATGVSMPSKAPARAAAPPAKGSGTILVVEDEEGVRGLIRRVLQGGGYTVLDAGDVDQAVARCKEYLGEIHLLLTDVVLPKAGGREVASRVAQLRPGVKVVYMSGYTDNAIVHQGVLDPGTAFIEKPVTPAVLLSRIRAFLG